MNSVSENKTRKPTYYTALAGECLVMAHLALNEFTPAMTFGNAKSVDIFLSSSSGSPCKIEVKTSRKNHHSGPWFGKNLEWRMSEKQTRNSDPNLFYCFVSIPENIVNQLPWFFVVRSKEVVDYLVNEHDYWINKVKHTPRFNPKHPHKERNFRIALESNAHGLQPIDKYENRWDILPR